MLPFYYALLIPHSNVRVQTAALAEVAEGKQIHSGGQGFGT